MVVFSLQILLGTIIEKREQTFDLIPNNNIARHNISYKKHKINTRSKKSGYLLKWFLFLSQRAKYHAIT